MNWTILLLYTTYINYTMLDKKQDKTRKTSNNNDWIKHHLNTLQGERINNTPHTKQHNNNTPRHPPTLPREQGGVGANKTMFIFKLQPIFFLFSVLFPLQKNLTFCKFWHFRNLTFCKFRHFTNLTFCK